MSNKNFTYLVAGISVLILLFAAWFFLFRSSSNTPLNTTGAGFGVGETRDVVIPLSGDSGGQVIASVPQNDERVFKISDGPVTGATFIQTLRPTTTIARFALQENGHIVDLVLDNSGQIPRAISNTTIPGTLRALWTEKGAGVVLQYLDGSVVKTVHLGFSTATTSQANRPVSIQFFPDNIQDIAASPDGTNVVYLLKTASGSDGYTAKANGTASKKIFSAPLSQMLISWPSTNTLLLSTKSASGIIGAVFSVSAASGAITPLVNASGITAIADRDFSRVVYQTVIGAAASYVRDTKTGKESSLAFDPIPEKCVWSPTSSSLLFCAAPVEAAPAGYLDLWHQGAASVPDAILSYDFAAGSSGIVTVPGSDGGVPSDIAELAVSPDNKYLLFVKKGDRSLWGARLGD